MALAQNLSNEMDAGARAAFGRYLTELVRFYPTAGTNYHVEPWLGHEQTYLVGIVPPQDEEEWADLSEAMATIATDLVVETGCLFVLTTLE
jgi:hypothetical protein